MITLSDCFKGYYKQDNITNKEMLLEFHISHQIVVDTEGICCHYIPSIDLPYQYDVILMVNKWDWDNDDELTLIIKGYYIPRNVSVLQSFITTELSEKFKFYILKLKSKKQAIAKYSTPNITLSNFLPTESFFNLEQPKYTFTLVGEAYYPYIIMSDVPLTDRYIVTTNEMQIKQDSQLQTQQTQNNINRPKEFDQLTIKYDINLLKQIQNPNSFIQQLLEQNAKQQGQFY